MIGERAAATSEQVTCCNQLLCNNSNHCRHGGLFIASARPPAAMQPGPAPRLGSWVAGHASQKRIWGKKRLASIWVDLGSDAACDTNNGTVAWLGCTRPQCATQQPGDVISNQTEQENIGDEDVDGLSLVPRFLGKASQGQAAQARQDAGSSINLKDGARCPV